jgi:hypothetical protein
MRDPHKSFEVFQIQPIAHATFDCILFGNYFSQIIIIPSGQGQQKLNNNLGVEFFWKLLEKKVKQNISFKSMPNITKSSQLHVVKS